MTTTLASANRTSFDPGPRASENLRRFLAAFDDDDPRRRPMDGGVGGGDGWDDATIIRDLDAFSTERLVTRHGPEVGDRLLRFFRPAIERAASKCAADGGDGGGIGADLASAKLRAYAMMYDVFVKFDGGISDTYGEEDGGGDSAIQLAEWIFGYRIALRGSMFAGLKIKSEVRAREVFKEMAGDDGREVDYDGWCDYLERMEVGEGTMGMHVLFDDSKEEGEDGSRSLARSEEETARRGEGEEGLRPGSEEQLEAEMTAQREGQDESLRLEHEEEERRVGLEAQENDRREEAEEETLGIKAEAEEEDCRIAEEEEEGLRKSETTKKTAHTAEGTIVRSQEADGRQARGEKHDERRARPEAQARPREEGNEEERFEDALDEAEGEGFARPEVEEGPGGISSKGWEGNRAEQEERAVTTGIDEEIESVRRLRQEEEAEERVCLPMDKPISDGRPPVEEPAGGRALPVGEASRNDRGLPIKEGTMRGRGLPIEERRMERGLPISESRGVAIEVWRSKRMRAGKRGRRDNAPPSPALAAAAFAIALALAAMGGCEDLTRIVWLEL